MLGLVGSWLIRKIQRRDRLDAVAEFATPVRAPRAVGEFGLDVVDDAPNRVDVLACGVPELRARR
jgi:hypothetical protein